MTVREQRGFRVGAGDGKPNIPDVAMVALVARAFCARPAVMMTRIIAAMQLVTPAGVLTAVCADFVMKSFRLG